MSENLSCLSFGVGEGGAKLCFSFMEETYIKWKRRMYIRGKDKKYSLKKEKKAPGKAAIDTSSWHALSSNKVDLISLP